MRRDELKCDKIWIGFAFVCFVLACLLSYLIEKYSPVGNINIYERVNILEKKIDDIGNRC